MNTLIVGSSGKIGKYFVKKKFKNFIYTYSSQKFKNGIKFNMLKNNIYPIIKRYNITKLVLLSAISDPDECFKKKKYSNEINIVKTIEIIKQCIKKNIYIIFLSSEFVYDGQKKNYSETDKILPKNLYGVQKKKVELFLRKYCKNYSILRIAKTYSDNLNDNTIITKFLRDYVNKKQIFPAASDQIFNPLYVKDLVKIIFFFQKKKINGIFNVGGPKSYSRYKLTKIFMNSAKKIKYKNYKPVIKKIKLSEIKLLEKRPLNVSMNINKLKSNISFKLKTIEEIQKKIITKKNASRIS